MKFGLGKVFEKFNVKKKVEASGYREPSFYGDTNKGKEEMSHSEDEWEVIKNDPEIKRTLTNNYILEHKISAADDLSDWQMTSFEKYELEDDLDNFENRNLLAEMTAPYAKEATEKKERAEMLENLDYNLLDFQNMQRAFRFQTLIDKIPGEKASRPVDAKGEPLSDKDIKEQVVEYQKISAKNNSVDFSEFELELMRKCFVWNHIYEDLRKGAKSPKEVGGRLYKKEDIEKLAEEYKELEKNDPRTFAELKVENKEWLKKNFAWKKEESQGKNQWAGYENTMGRDWKGKEVTKTVRYILKNIPDGINPKSLLEKKDYFLQPRYILPVKGKYCTLVFVELRPPYPVQELEKETPIEAPNALL